MEEIVTIVTKEQEAFLRTKTVNFDFALWEKKDIQALVKRMRAKMKELNGVGLSANQIGHGFRMFVAQVPDSQGRQKFYAVFNPKLTVVGKEKETIEEGCLSVPGFWGPVSRDFKVVLDGYDMHGKKIKIKAWGLLARVFQHETDHLDGVLFIDRAKKIYKVTDLDSKSETHHI